jgi:hypothetical protein
MNAHQGSGNRPGLDIHVVSARLLCKEAGQLGGVARGDLALAGLQRPAAADQRRPLRDRSRRPFLGKPLVALGQHPVEHRPRALTRAAVPDGADQALAERPEASEHQVLLGREVLEDRDLGNLGCPGDLGHRHSVEAALGKQPRRFVEDQLPGLLLLPLTESRLG